MQDIPPGEAEIRESFERCRPCGIDLCTTFVVEYDVSVMADVRLSATLNQGNGQARIQGGRLGRSPHLKPKKATFFTIILYNLENNIRDFVIHCFVTAVL